MIFLQAPTEGSTENFGKGFVDIDDHRGVIDCRCGYPKAVPWMRPLMDDDGVRVKRITKTRDLNLRGSQRITDKYIFHNDRSSCEGVT
jgi:hypothetical protein